MRILIVNAYHDTEAGFKSFGHFQQSIQKAFMSQKYFSKEEIKFSYADYNTIDEYLYEQSTAYVDTQSEKKFDYLDFIFIDGEPNMLPWYPRCQKFLILLRMCKRTKKVLFAAGCGMLIQVYLCSNKYHINRVINGNGKGTGLDKIHLLKPEQLRDIQPGDVFLDSGTGDFYCYDSSTSEFFPIVNIGFHHHKVAEDMENSEAILKPYKYYPKCTEFSQPINAGKRSEAVCRVLKQHVQHWLVKDIGLQEFLISQKNSWNLHPINVKDTNSHFTIIAESDRSPQVIVQFNTVGTLFNINPVYPVSVKILNNYIDRMLQLYQKDHKLDLPLSSVPYLVVPCKPAFALGSSSSRPITASTAKLDTSVYPGTSYNPKSLRPASSHSGFAISKRKNQSIIVKNNATRQDPIQVNAPLIRSSPSSFLSIENRHPTTRIKGSFDRFSNVYALRQQMGFGSTSIGEQPYTKNLQNTHFTETFKTSPVKTQENNYQAQIIKMNDAYDSKDDSCDLKLWNKNDIRGMLHGNDYKSPEDVQKKKKIRIIYRASSTKKIKNEVKSTPNQKSKTLKYPFPGSVTSSGPYIEPYKHQFRPETRSNWITSEGFNANNRIRESSPAIIRNYGHYAAMPIYNSKQPLKTQD